MRLEEQTIHVGQFDFVVVEHFKTSDTATRQHFGRDASDAADADDDDAEAPDRLVVLHDAHSLQRHQTRIRIRVDDLRGHLGDLAAFRIGRGRGQRGLQFGDLRL